MSGTVGLINKLKQVIYGLPLKTGKSRRDKIAHFCEHHGIRIKFTPAKTTWHAIAPSAMRPWWLKLNTLKTANSAETNNRETTRVLENA